MVELLTLIFFDDQHFNVVDDVMDNVVDDVMGVQDHAMLQAYFDSVDIPAGVEAPVPWLADPSLRKEKTVIGSDPIYVEPASEISSSSPRTVDVLGYSAKKDFSSSLAHPQSAHSKNVAHFHKVQKNTAASQSAGSTAAPPFYGTLPIPQWVGEKSKSNGKLVTSGTSTNYKYVNHYDPMIHPHGVGP